MGQPITVTEKPTTQAGVVRFELNRSLTGMDHERYRSPADAAGNRPPDVLARRLLEHGGIDAVHVHGNVVTVDLSEGAKPDGLADTIRDLFIHYTEGVEPSLP
jgi:hypothetical protein